MPNRNRTPLAVAALSFELNLANGQVPQEFRLFPAGRFRAADGSGRPAKPAAGWLMNAAAAQRLIAAAQARQNDYLLDYEHATLTATKAGQKAPAAGWFKSLEWREGDGLYVIEPRFTAVAAEHIAALEYRYVSPVFASDQQTGEVMAFYHAALVNNPGLDGLTDFSALSAHPDFTFPPHQEQSMKTLLAALGLPETATEAEGLAALSALQAQHATSVTALQAQTPDPAKYVGVETMQALQSQVAALTADLNGGKVDKIVADALSCGKLLPAQEAWAKELGKTNLVALTGYVDSAQAIAALGGMQTGNADPAGAGKGVAALSATDIASAAQFGISHEDFLKSKATA